MKHTKDHMACVSILHDLAVQSGSNEQVAGVRDLGDSQRVGHLEYIGAQVFRNPENIDYEDSRVGFDGREHHAPGPGSIYL